MQINIQRLAKTKGRQRGIEFVESRFGPFADELGGDVQVVQWTPLDGRFRTKGSQQAFEKKRSFGRQIQGSKESHCNDAC